MGRGREGASLEVVVQGRALACSLVDCRSTQRWHRAGVKTWILSQVGILAPALPSSDLSVPQPPADVTSV